MRSKVVVGLLMVLVTVFYLFRRHGSRKREVTLRFQERFEGRDSGFVWPGRAICIVDPYGMVPGSYPGRSRTDQGFQSQSLETRLLA
jgi:hypothetical protein